MQVREMTDTECANLIASSHLARLACCRDGQPYIVPIHYSPAGTRLYSFSMQGKKLDILHSNPKVCLEIEDYRKRDQWATVVVEAVFHELPDTEKGHYEHNHAWSLLQSNADWWEPGSLKPHPDAVGNASPPVFFALDIETATGRRAVPD